MLDLVSLARLLGMDVARVRALVARQVVDAAQGVYRPVFFS